MRQYTTGTRPQKEPLTGFRGTGRFARFFMEGKPMTLISFDEAATRLGMPRQTVEDWVRRGLLSMQAGASANGSPGSLPCIDEEELAHLAESIGWLSHSTDQWESDEGP